VNRPNVRAIPWLLALIGLAIPLVGSGFTLWLIVIVWLCVLALCWVIGRLIPMTRRARIVAAVALLPVLFLLAWEGGWWLIPADLAWLATELAGRGVTEPRS
jgi:hypothetical protein